MFTAGEGGRRNAGGPVVSARQGQESRLGLQGEEGRKNERERNEE